jgi:uncharacterized membrane protein
MRGRRIAFVACHRRADRSFSFRGRQFPVCARCTGILAGYLVYPCFLFDLVSLPMWLGLLLSVPAGVDGVTQALGSRSSTNGLRLATGLMSGVGQVAVISSAGRFIARLILNALGG